MPFIKILEYLTDFSAFATLVNFGVFDFAASVKYFSAEFPNIETIEKTSYLMNLLFDCKTKVVGKTLHIEI